MVADSLLVIIPDRLSVIVAKGEITDRYYNPGDLFDEVHILMTNEDDPDPSTIRRCVGRARLHLHNLPSGKNLFVKTLGWRPSLLNKWADAAVMLAREISPALVRCHGGLLNAYAAYRIKDELGVPYIVSLHTNPIDGLKVSGGGLKGRMQWAWISGASRIALRNADTVVPVYQSIIPYLRGIGVSGYQVIYNVINPASLTKKTSYELSDPVRVICVGRQIPGKDPSNIVRAIARLPRVHLTLVGDGPLNSHVRRAAEECEVQDRVSFCTAMSNDELCRRLPEHDIFASNNAYAGISKALLEALLTGLPVVTDRKDEVPELQGDFLLMVEDTVDGYCQGFQRLIDDNAFRAELGRKARVHAAENWAPDRTEAEYVRVYEQTMEGAQTG